jgi:lipid-A-disaccharide synthase
MTPLSLMFLAGETSGDTLAAELATALRPRLLDWQDAATNAAQPLHTALAPRCFGAGRERMREAGIELVTDMTAFGVVGFSDVLKRFLALRKVFHQLLKTACERQPAAIVGVDYGGFNLRFAAAIHRRTRALNGPFNNWRPRLIQFVSPQVWASRPGRATRMEQTHDLLLSIFPFERAWYARHAPRLRVEFVGHPIFDRYPASGIRPRPPVPELLLLPGSRVGELKRHLLVLFAAVQQLRDRLPDLRVRMVLPGEPLRQLAQSLGPPPGVETQVGGLADALRQATVAIASTGTVTVECAYFGVPTVTLYKTSRSTYEIGRRLVNVTSLTMPNLLAGEAIFPEFIQDAATPDALAAATFDLLANEQQCHEIQAKLRRIVATLGGPGATGRAADAIVRLLQQAPR